MEKERKRRRTNPGCLKPGYYPRRRRFTRTKCQAGFRKAIESSISRFPGAVDGSGRRMLCDFLTVAGRRNNKEEIR
jgi:hypothetical protein